MRTFLVLVLVAAVAICSGCATMPLSSVMAPITITQSPVAVGDPSVGMSKVGEAKTEGIILVSFGDASLSTAMRNGNISKIHHVDSEELCVLGIYSRYTVKVYGE